MLEILNVKKNVASPRVSCSVHTHPPGGRIFRVCEIWKQRHLTENFNVECGNHNSMPLPGVPRGLKKSLARPVQNYVKRVIVFHIIFFHDPQGTAIVLVLYLSRLFRHREIAS